MRTSVWRTRKVTPHTIRQVVLRLLFTVEKMFKWTSGAYGGIAGLLVASFSGCGGHSFLVVDMESKTTKLSGGNPLIGQSYYECAAPVQNWRPRDMCDAQNLWDQYCIGRSCAAAPAPVVLTTPRCETPHSFPDPRPLYNSNEPPRPSPPHSLEPVEPDIRPAPRETMDPSSEPAVSPSDKIEPKPIVEPSPENAEPENETVSPAPPSAPSVDVNEAEKLEAAPLRILDNVNSNDDESAESAESPVESRETDPAPDESTAPEDSLPNNELPENAVPLNALPMPDPPGSSATRPTIRLRWTSRIRTSAS